VEETIYDYAVRKLAYVESTISLCAITLCVARIFRLFPTEYFYSEINMTYGHKFVIKHG